MTSWIPFIHATIFAFTFSEGDIRIGCIGSQVVFLSLQIVSKLTGSINSIFICPSKIRTF